jgi:hypothetical protein
MRAVILTALLFVVVVAALVVMIPRVEGMTEQNSKRAEGCTNLWGDIDANAKDVPGGVDKKDVRVTYHLYAPGYETSSLACADRFWADPAHGKKLMKYPWTAYCLDGRSFSQDSCGKCLRVTNRRTGASAIARAVDNGGCTDKDGTGLDLDPCMFNAIDTDKKGVADGHMRVDVREVDCGEDGTIGSGGSKPDKPNEPDKPKKPKTPKPKRPKSKPDKPRKPGGGSGWSASDLPPPSQEDKNWCKTWMSDETDTGECFALAYHHCVDGRKDESKIPQSVRGVKDSAMKQVYDVQKTCTHDNNGKVRPYKCFSKAPSTWTSVCVARPDMAGKGKCKKVSKDEWRMWVKGEDPQRESECQFSSLYLKSHFRGDKIQGQYVGKHGRG